jgi:hypothetical protein
MATIKNKCKNCGCEDKALTTPAPCPTPEGCITPEPCSEVFDAQCVVYTGDPIVCGDDVIVDTNTNMSDALNQLINYFCQTPPPPPSISWKAEGCDCVQLDNTSGEFATLAECEDAEKFESPCGVTTDCSEPKYCIPCTGCGVNPIQYLFNIAIEGSCNASCYCISINSTPEADPEQYDPTGLFNSTFSYEIEVDGDTYYLWYNDVQSKWYLSLELGNSSNAKAVLSGPIGCPAGTYSSLQSPFTSFVVNDGCEVPA